MDDSHFQTKSEIQHLLESADRRPRKRLGQNFLIDRNLMRKLVERSGIEPSDCVLEVGAGTGSLTGMLATVARRVVASEIDPILAVLVVERMRRFDNVTIVPGDALQDKSTIAPALLSAVRAAHGLAGGTLRLVANLPYDIATPLVIDLLLSDLPVRRMCVTVQSEVADRFMGRPRTKSYGPVGIVSQALTTVGRICRMPPQVFWPRPKVSSTMLRLDVRERGPVDPKDAPAFARFVRGSFLHRRQTMSHNARRMEDPDLVGSALAAAGIDARCRPEEISVEQWIDLFHRIRGLGEGQAADEPR